MSPLFSQKSICRIAALTAALLLLLSPLSPAAQAETDSTPSPAPTEAGFHFDADFSRETLGEAIERYLAENGCTGNSVAVGWYDVKSGEEWYHNADTYMEGASIYKLPLSMVYADKIAAGELTDGDRIGSYTLGDALRLTLVDSNNNTARRLRDELSDNYAEYRGILAQYCRMDPASLPREYYSVNHFSARYMIGTLRTLYENAEKYETIIDYMKQARPDGYLSLYRGGVEVAHKIGTDSGHVCDVGIVFTERPFLIAVLTDSTPNGTRRIGEIGRIAMDYAEYLAAGEPAALPDETPETGEEDEIFATAGFGGAVDRYLAEKGLDRGQILIGWQDVESGVTWYHGADVLMDGSNTYRLPLCMLYADWVDDGLLSLDDKVGAYVLERAVAAVLTSPSPNPADALRYGVSYDHREYRTAIAKNCGMDVETLPSAYFMANQFSPRFLIGTLRSLWDGGEKYDWLIKSLKQAQPDSAIGLYRGEYELAHVIGRSDTVYCDTGLVYTERPFLLTVMTGGVPNAERLIGSVARIAMDYAEYLAAHPGFEPVPAPEPEEPESTPAPEQAPIPTLTPTFRFEADFARESLGDVIERYLTEKKLQNARFLIGWRDLESGEEWFRGGDTFMEAASTYKLPLAMVYADKIAAGELTEDDKIGQYRLGDALKVMLIDSNNFAAQRLRDNLSRDFVEYREMLVPYGGLDADTLPKGFYTANQFSPRFLINTLQTLHDNSDTYALVLDYMKQARQDSFLSLYSGEIEVAHKYGSDENFVCDTGIVYAERPFLITVMTYGVGDAMHRIAEIGRIAMDYAEYLSAPESGEELAGERASGRWSSSRTTKTANTARATTCSPP